MVARPLSLGPLGAVHAQTLAERCMIPVFYKCKQMKSIDATVCIFLYFLCGGTLKIEVSIYSLFCIKIL